MLHSVLSVNSFNTLNFAVHFHVHLTHKQCFDIESQFHIVDLDKLVIFWS